MRARLRRFLSTRIQARILGILICLILWLIYQSNGRFIGGSDVYTGRFVPVSLVTELDYDLNEFMFIRNNDPRGWAPGGRYYNKPGQPYHGRTLSTSPTFAATLMAPFYWLPFRALGVSPRHFLVFYMDKAFASLFCVLAAWFLYRALREKHTPRPAAYMISMAMALGTSVWAVASQAMWQHPPSVCFLALSLWLWVRSSRKRRGFFFLGLAAGAAVGARPSNAFWVLLVAFELFFVRDFRGKARTLFLSFRCVFHRRFRWAFRVFGNFLRRFKPIIPYALGGLPTMVFLGIYNWYHFGAPWTTAYSMFGKGVAATLEVKNLMAGVLGILFSPSLGLLPNAPFFIFVPLSLLLYVCRKGSRPRAHVVFPLLFVLANIALYSSRNQGWWGGWAFCYRYLIDSMPMAVFLLVGLWRLRIHRKWRIPNFMLRFAVWSVFTLFFLWSFFVQAFGAFIWTGHYYRKWENINQRLTVSLKKEYPFVEFSAPSVHWSFKKEEHLILCELRYFPWKPTGDQTWPQFIKVRAERWATTPAKVKQDLIVHKHVKYGTYAPIILEMGR